MREKGMRKEERQNGTTGTRLNLAPISPHGGWVGAGWGLDGG